jgi:hypothetical protein
MHTKFWLRNIKGSDNFGVVVVTVIVVMVVVVVVMVVVVVVVIACAKVIFAEQAIKQYDSCTNTSLISLTNEPLLLGSCVVSKD